MLMDISRGPCNKVKYNPVFYTVRWFPLVLTDGNQRVSFEAWRCGFRQWTWAIIVPNNGSAPCRLKRMVHFTARVSLCKFSEEPNMFRNDSTVCLYMFNVSWIVYLILHNKIATPVLRWPTALELLGWIPWYKHFVIYPCSREFSLEIVK